MDDRRAHTPTIGRSWFARPLGRAPAPACRRHATARPPSRAGPTRRARGASGWQPCRPRRPSWPGPARHPRARRSRSADTAAGDRHTSTPARGPEAQARAGRARSAGSASAPGTSPRNSGRRMRGGRDGSPRTDREHTPAPRSRPCRPGAAHRHSVCRRMQRGDAPPRVAASARAAACARDDCVWWSSIGPRCRSRPPRPRQAPPPTPRGPVQAVRSGRAGARRTGRTACAGAGPVGRAGARPPAPCPAARPQPPGGGPVRPTNPPAACRSRRAERSRHWGDR